MSINLHYRNKSRNKPSLIPNFVCMLMIPPHGSLHNPSSKGSYKGVKPLEGTGVGACYGATTGEE